MRPKLTNARPTGPTTGVKDSIRSRGSKDLMVLESGVPQSVFIDAMFLSNEAHQIPILASNFGLYEKYFVHNVELEFVPNQPVTVGGTVSAAPDYDPLDPMPVDASALSASKGYISKPVTQGFRCKMPNLKGPDGEYYRPSLYCGPSSDDRLVSYGQFHVLGAGTGLANGTSIGRLIIHFDISFFIMEPRVALNYYTSDMTGLEFEATHLGLITPSSTMSVAAADSLDRILFKAGAITMSVAPNQIVSAIIGELGAGLVIESAMGRKIHAGTRIFLKAADKYIDWVNTNTYPVISSETNCGYANLSRTFAAGTALSFVRTAPTTLGLKDVIRMF